jgi:DNA-binding transcriptional MerR regulator/quercetin dioxygenase-like cupin family protein
MLKVSPSTLRLWERMGLCHPTRSDTGYRMYSQAEVERLKRVQRLRVEHNLNVNGILHVMSADESAAEVVSLPPPDSSPIHRQLRKLRLERRMTLAEAAERAGLSSSFLSSLELGQTNASIATLQKLAVLYETNVLSFFGQPSAVSKLVRKRDRQRLQSEPGVTMELLAHGRTAMEPHLFSIAPGTSSGGAYQHRGEEFVYVLRGECEFWLDEVEHYRLRSGDCLYFSSQQAHRWNNPGSVECALLWINTPPTF